MNNEELVDIINDATRAGTQAIQKEKWLKKNWKFVAICLTVLLCVAMVCGTVYGVTCHFATLNTLKEVVYATEIITETSTVDQNTGEGGDNYYQAGDNNAIGGE